MGRFAARAALALFTAVVFFLFQSVFWATAIPIVMKAAFVGVVLLSYFRPLNGLLVIAALAPLAGAWSPLFAGRVRGAETLVLAFLAGALLRGWTLHQFRRIPSDRLQVAAALFGAIVAGSAMYQLRVSGVPAPELVSRIGAFYLLSVRGLSMVFHGMLFLEGLALLVYIVHYSRTRPLFAARLVRMLICGAVGAAALNFAYFANELMDTGAPAAHLARFLVSRRWSAHVGDVNAAGSFFGMIVVIAAGLATNNRRRAVWLAVAGVVGLALWLTASRTAFAGVLIAGVMYAFSRILATSSSRRRSAALAMAACMVLVVLAIRYVPAQSRKSASARAVTIRWLYLQTTWRMVEAHPLFGVGIGQYARWSTSFSSPELLSHYDRENAHNNFAQVAGELGLVGLAAFVGVLGICLWPGVSVRRPHPLVPPVIAGVSAFMITWLGGHPLLVPEVAYPFWMTLAIVPGVSFDLLSESHD